MAYYIVNNKQNDGQYNEVHAHTCAYLPHPDNSTPIGEFQNCHDAVDKAASPATTGNIIDGRPRGGLSHRVFRFGPKRST